MNAIEFVREFAVFGAKEYLAGATFYKDKLMVFTDIDDLKQIVEAFELVERFGGLFSAKVSLNKEGYTGGIECGDDLIDDDQLKKAINLVEQCQND